MSESVQCPDTPRPKEVVKPKKPVSPKYTRLNEKEDLANLNNRLACYIDRVRTLETENNRLSHEMKFAHETFAREVSGVKTLYENELSDARKLLDELSREKAKIQIDTQRLFTENDELKATIEKKNTEINNLRVEITLLDSRLNDVSNKYNFTQSEKKNVTEANKTLAEEKAKLTDELSLARQNLEEEILKRVDAENSLQTLKEEYAFGEHLLKQQLLDVQRKVELERSEIDGKLNQQYEERLCRSLQEIRDQYETDLEENKEEIKKMYEEKIRSLENQLSRNNSIASMAMDELQSMQAKVECLNKQIDSLEKERGAALINMRETEKKLDRVKSEYMNQYSVHEVEIKKMREKMAQQIKDYEELMDVKVALDMEISAFRKLLECEEARLNITPVTPSENSSRRILKGKRRHEESLSTESSYSLNSSNSDSVTITEVSPAGKYIRICNNSNGTITIGGWQLIQKVGGTNVAYKFSRNFKLKAGLAVTVWSADEPDIPDGSDQLLMKNQCWMSGDQMSVTLLNTKDEEIAVTELSKVTSTSSLRARGKRPPSAGSFASNSSFADEKCSVM